MDELAFAEVSCTNMNQSAFVDMSSKRERSEKWNCASVSVPQLLLFPSMDEFTIVENYLRYGKYLDGLQKGEKANLRSKCHNNFLFESGLLYYNRARSRSEIEELWRVYVRTTAEKERLWIPAMRG